MKNNQFISFFEEYKSQIEKNSNAILNSFRDEAFMAFSRLGFSSKDADYYRFIDLPTLFNADYGVNVNCLQPTFNPYQKFHCDVPGINSFLYYVVNDVFVDSLISDLPEGVIICGLKQAVERCPELLKQYYGKSVKMENDGVLAFNMSFAQDGFFIYVPEGVVVEKPIQLVNILTGNRPLLATTHNVIILEKGAKANLVVCDHSLDKNVDLLANRITEVFVAEGVEYDHYKVESTTPFTKNISTLVINQAEKSSVVANIITLHNGITRNNIEVNLCGEDAKTTLCGIFIGGENQYSDNATSISHYAPRCTSKELFKYILEDNSKGNFLGRIHVAEGALKTEAYQTNRNICLTKNARMYTKPQLEIYNDDVKCSHGATVGQLDDNAMFYMRSRGIPEKEARLLLMSAFATDVLDNIRIESLKDRIRFLVDKRLRGNGSHCEGCVICK